MGCWTVYKIEGQKKKGYGGEDIVKERLVRKAQNGDKEAFLSLMGEFEMPMYRTAKAILHREDDVEDAVQEAVCRAFYKIGEVRKPRSFGAWLMRVVINCCYDLLRDQRGIVPLELLPERACEEDRDAVLDIREALAALGENDRLILTLYYLNDLTVREVAKVLSISEGAVKQRLAHGRRRFREAYELREQERRAVSYEK